MSFVKIQIDFLFRDAIRNGDAFELTKVLLVHLACPTDNIVYLENGLIRTLVKLTKLSKSNICKALDNLKKRGFLKKADEFSCQMSEEFMSKTDRKLPISGAIQPDPSNEEEALLFEVYALAVESWKARGKILTKHINEDKDVIKRLEKELKAEREASEQRYNNLMATMKEVLSHLSCGEEEKKKAVVKLQLVHSVSE